MKRVIPLLLALWLAPAWSAAQDTDRLLRLADEAEAKGLPSAAVSNKIREGLAKGVAPGVIERVVRQMTANLEAADALMREMTPPPAGVERERSVTLVAEALGGGVTADEVRDLRQRGQAAGKPSLDAESVATAAKGLALIKDTRLPAADGSAVIVEAIRQGFRPADVLELGRAVKRREADYRAGRATLQALREAIARGERPEQLFRETRTEAPATVERPNATAARPDTATRPERPAERPAARPETPVRPEAPVRPERPSRPS